MPLFNFKPSYAQGFTLVEVTITIAIAAIFVIAISQIYVTQTRLTSITSAYNNADLLAYNNLRTYADGRSPSWFQCTYTGSVPDSKIMFTSTSPVSGVPSPVTQTVTASAPYGCGGSSSGIGYPIKVQSVVTYGTDGKTVVHATYSTY